MHKKSKVLLVSSYQPRECGIATFSHDLVTSISSGACDVKMEIIPVNEPGGDERNYGDEINISISQEDKASYEKAADYINSSDAIAVSIQHEYGLYGGKCGEYIVDFIDRIHKPVIVTLHTVLIEPKSKQKEILQKIADKSSFLVVMAEAAIKILDEVYGIPSAKIKVIPHGVPETTFDNQEEAKKALGLQDNLVISTFGLIGPGKGLEYAIEALPKVKLAFPKIKYLILGKTHPSILKAKGEAYRQKLLAKISKLGLQDQVQFVNRFLPKEEIILNLKACDLYVTPYLNSQQIISGTLAYAVSIGRVCISTPYIYAKELLADGRGNLIPFRNSEALSDAIIALLSDPSKRKEAEKKSYLYSRQMTWKSVSKRYNDLFKSFT